MHTQDDTIVALSTTPGSSAIAVIRMSGKSCFSIADEFFVGKIKVLEMQSHSAQFGKLIKDEQTLDEVVLAKFSSPRTYTGEDIVEISCHGSMFIVEAIIELILQKGARLATAGEFTQRAFMNGKLDLSQAEAVADLIASDNAAQHKIAMQQLRGGYSNELKDMREQLINFCALIELELDFSEEDVAFADRTQLQTLLNKLLQKLSALADSFKLGNAIKKGIPVAIVGKPNVGKSTLLNALLNEERAIVSSIAGTTRDTIEDVLQIDGISFRFIDTAGIRSTNDEIENKGIERSLQKIKEAQIVLLLCNVAEHIEDIIEEYKQLDISIEQQVILVLNKADEFVHGVCNAYDVEEALATKTHQKCIAISAKNNLHIDQLKKLLIEVVAYAKHNSNQLVVSNVRHHSAIVQTIASLEEVQLAFNANLSGELLSIDIRRALHTLGSITGDIEVDRDILGTIFGKFCIGK
jgi:tRNA modification GTPase